MSVPWYSGKAGLKPTGTGKDAVEFTKALLQEVDNAPDDYMRTFKKMWKEGKSAKEIGRWSNSFLAAERGVAKAGALARIGKWGGKVLFWLGVAANTAQAKDSIEEYNRDVDAGLPRSEALRTQRYRWGSVEGNTPEEQYEVDHARSESFFDWLQGK